MAELGAVYPALRHDVEDEVCVVMKSFYVSTHQKQYGILCAANIEIWGVSIVDAAKLTCGDGGPCAFAGEKNALNSQRHSPRSGRSLATNLRVRKWIRADQELNA